MSHTFHPSRGLDHSFRGWQVHSEKAVQRFEVELSKLRQDRVRSRFPDQAKCSQIP